MSSDFRNLIAWQKAMDLADRAYDAALLLPRYELFGLGQQMRTAALSVPNNIAEGQGRWSSAEYRQFLRQARGPAYELLTQVLFARRRGFITDEMAHELVARAKEVARLINGLLRHLRQR